MFTTSLPYKKICSFESYNALKMENIDDILIKVLMSCCRVSSKGESWTPRPTVNDIADTTSLRQIANSSVS